MCATKLGSRPGYLWSVLSLKCSRCRKGNMFKIKNSYNLKGFMKMNDRCPVCDQPMEIEIGFYYGTGYVSYALAFVFSIMTFILWWVSIGFSLSDDDNRLSWWIGFNIFSLIMLQPYLMRLSRSLWLSFFVGYNAGWALEKPEQPERIVPGQMNNW